MKRDLLNFHTNGFTLTEVLIVVVIIAILATFSLPMFVKTLEKAKVGEAISNLNLIRTGEKIYFLENRFFSSAIEELNIENPNDSASRYFNYDVTVGGGDFIAKATRAGGDSQPAPPDYTGDEYTISKDGKIEGPLLP